ncbi:hypothetical protein [Corallincola spongiicola]|uniref:Uncharacterized protein n=1 Tax=Corallincola spongiicola TaxID=2520508 RepID=A0ABY1WMQ1_9GAMM|nr:hypothetical protein [Corallincola spongiicola]TAA43696.1 hypothetical protein EXY25_14190 [Corallincola spongiicola]
MKFIVLVVVFNVLLGCRDKWYEPRIKVMHSSNVVLNVSYSDGKKYEKIYYECNMYYLGQESSRVTSIEYVYDNKVYYYEVGPSLLMLIKKEREVDPTTYFGLGPNGITIETSSGCEQSGEVILSPGSKS